MVYSSEVVSKGVWQCAFQTFENFKSIHLVLYTANFLQLYTVPVVIYYFQFLSLNVLKTLFFMVQYEGTHC